MRWCTFENYHYSNTGHEPRADMSGLQNSDQNNNIHHLPPISLQSYQLLSIMYLVSQKKNIILETWSQTLISRQQVIEI